MGYQVNREQMNTILKKWQKEYVVYGPKCMEGEGRFSDTDVIRYGNIDTIEELVFDKKSDYSFKECLLPITQTLFFFTEDQVKESEEAKKGAIIFLRSCDMHSVKRLDEIYLNNGFEDHYYKRLREKAIFILMGCDSSFEDCFCVSMGTNRTEEYDLSIQCKEAFYYINNKKPNWDSYFLEEGKEMEVIPDFVEENEVSVTIPKNLDLSVMNSAMWDEYNARCIGCGRCNFVCPTCTCFTMQDIFYTDNGKVGERRRVWASCMVDGYTDMAGNISYRKDQGQRMRFRVLHKIYDYKKRNGYHMCVGCGRCDAICPEYISFTSCINKLEDAMREVGKENE